jgi:dihydroflavonol-4-reductase
MIRVLVTGANSFLAGNAITELLRRGYMVRGMVRKTSRLMIRHSNLEHYYGNITEEKDVIRAAKGCEIIIHIAALTDQSIADYRVYERVNIDGTRNIIRASLENKVKKVVYVSTANVFGYGTKAMPGDETRAMQPPFTGSGYAVSKAGAQQLIIKKLLGSGSTITVVNPTFMVGPNDYKISSNRIILRAAGKWILFIPPGGKNFIHVRDAAAGICNAIEQGNDGESYILANENLTYREFYLKLFRVIKQKPIVITIPKYLLLLAGLAGEIARYAGINTELCLTNMKILSLGNYYCAGKAVKFINLPQTPTEKAIEDAISWFENTPSVPTFF